MFKYDAYDIYSYNQYFEFNITHEFGVKENITFAFGMASRRPNFIKDIEDYGSVKAIYQSWSDAADDFVFTDIPSRACTF